MSASVEALKALSKQMREIAGAFDTIGREAIPTSQVRVWADQLDALLLFPPSAHDAVDAMEALRDDLLSERCIADGRAWSRPGMHIVQCTECAWRTRIAGRLSAIISLSDSARTTQEEALAACSHCGTVIASQFARYCGPCERALSPAPEKAEP